jgi:hypothetical protein
MLQIVRQNFVDEGLNVQDIDHLVVEWQYWVGIARQYREADFASIHAHSFIATWSAVEACIEDTIVLILMNDSNASNLLNSAGIRSTQSQSGTFNENDSRINYRRIEAHFRRNVDVGVGYRNMLYHFGIQFDCEQNTYEKMAEMNAIRNCILHRGGIIDDKAVEHAPALCPYIGQRFNISQASYLVYYDALKTFLISMLREVVQSTYF